MNYKAVKHAEEPSMYTSKWMRHLPSHTPLWENQVLQHYHLLLRVWGNAEKDSYIEHRRLNDCEGPSVWDCSGRYMANTHYNPEHCSVQKRPHVCELSTLLTFKSVDTSVPTWKKEVMCVVHVKQTCIFKMGKL